MSKKKHNKAEVVEAEVKETPMIGNDGPANSGEPIKTEATKTETTQQFKDSFKDFMKKTSDEKEKVEEAAKTTTDLEGERPEIPGADQISKMVMDAIKDSSTDVQALREEIEALKIKIKSLTEQTDYFYTKLPEFINEQTYSVLSLEKRTTVVHLVAESSRAIMTNALVAYATAPWWRKLTRSSRETLIDECLKLETIQEFDKMLADEMAEYQDYTREEYEKQLQAEKDRLHQEMEEKMQEQMDTEEDGAMEEPEDVPSEAPSAIKGKIVDVEAKKE